MGSCRELIVHYFPEVAVACHEPAVQDQVGLLFLQARHLLRRALFGACSVQDRQDYTPSSAHAGRDWKKQWIKSTSRW